MSNTRIEVGINVVIAMDAFKGGLTAAEACNAVAGGLKAVRGDIDSVCKPMADGGEGTAAAMLSARPGGEWISMTVPGPLPGQTVTAGFAFWSDDDLALVELATASGLPLVPAAERNPLRTSTEGTGVLIGAARDQGAKQIVLAVGGSATADGGVGAATALGWRFLDAQKRAVPPGGGNLSRIAHILPPEDGRCLPPLSVLCDVDNPLCGPEGAAAVFGPQKGADADMIRILDEGLFHLAACIREQLDVAVADVPGAGAAGGMAAGAIAFMGGRLESGIERIIDVVGLQDVMRQADACITGEGSFDAQSLRGKVVSGVIRVAASVGVPVSVIAGRVTMETAHYQAHGVQTALATHDPNMPLEEVLRRETELVRETAARWMREYSNRMRSS